MLGASTAFGLVVVARMAHDGSVSGALFSRDGSRILSWSYDKTLRLWDAATGAPIGPAMRHDGPVSGALFSRDESRILSWSYDKPLRLWDAATGAPIGPAMRHDGSVLARCSAGTKAASCRGRMTRRCGCGTPRPGRRSARR